MKTHCLLSLLLLCGFAASATPLESVSEVQTTDTASLSYKMQRREDLINSIHVVGNPTASQDSVNRLLRQFYMDQFRHFQDPEAPYFMFMSRDAKLALGMGGKLQVNGWYGWNGIVDDSDFKPYEIPVPKNITDKRKLDASPAETSIFLTLLGNTHHGAFMAYIEGGFSGYKSRGFKLKKAYLTFRDWTVGYAKSTFSDPGAEIPVVDGGGQNGKMGHTTTLVRWIHGFRGGWKVAASLELPDYGIQTVDSMVRKQSVYVPDVAAFLQYGWGESHVRLSGIFRVLPYRDLLAGRNHSKIGWGVQLSSAAQVSRRLTLFAMANVGQGISSYSNDLGVDSYDLVSDLSRPGVMYAPTAWSLALGAQYYFTKNVYSSLTLSEARYMPSRQVLPTDYKYGLYGAVNVFWDITSRLQAGVEYLLGKRQNFDRRHACANRIEAMFSFSF